MFSNPNKELKNLKAKQIKLIYFYYSNIRTIIEITSPCDCSSVENDVVNKRIIVKYTPKKISKHLLLEGHTTYQTKKTFTVTYVTEQGTNETAVLSFTATVQDNN